MMSGEGRTHLGGVAASDETVAKGRTVPDGLADPLIRENQLVAFRALPTCTRCRPRAAVGRRVAGGRFVPEAGIQRAELEFDKFSVGGR
jgi:hypothetical protein